MKRLVVSISILLGVLFVLAQAFGAAETEQKERERVSRNRVPKYSRVRTRRSRADANSLAAELKFLADANAIRNKLKEFEGLEKGLEKVTKGGGKEMREWMRGPIEERIHLVKAVESQVNAELAFVRKLAIEEGATKTAAAVEGLLLDRQERFGEIRDKMGAEMRRMRRGERGYRRSRSRFRNTRDRYRERDRYQDAYSEQEMRRDSESNRDRQRNRYRDNDRYWDRDREDRRSGR